MENPKFKPHISKKKERIITDLVALMKEYPVVGILDMTNLPALQFQRIKSKLSEVLEFRMVKKRLIKIAFDKVKDNKRGIEQLKEKLEGIPALIFTKEDPFKIAKAIKKEVSSAPARPGQIAPIDLIVPAGPTPFTPGPMIGELGAMGIKTKVESGKINVIEDKVLVKKGDEISAQSAGLLSKLGVEPMEIGFNLLLTYKDGEILVKDILFVDEKLYLDTLKQYASESMNLALHVEYMCKDTAERLIAKAENEAKAIDGKVDLKVEPKEEVKEEPKEEVKSVEQPEKKEETQVEKKEEIKEDVKGEVKEEVKEPKEEVKEEAPVEEKPQEEKPVEEPVKEEAPVEQSPEEPQEEKPQEEVKEELKEEPKEEEKPEEKKLEEVKKGEVTVGLKQAKDITKGDMDLAAKQLQQIQDNLIKGKV